MQMCSTANLCTWNHIYPIIHPGLTGVKSRQTLQSMCKWQESAGIIKWRAKKINIQPSTHNPQRSILNRQPL